MLEGLARGGPGASSGATAPSGTTGTGGTTGATGPIQDEQALCSEIPSQDVQALVTFPVGAPQSGPIGCEFVLPGESVNGDALGIQLYPGDADGHWYETNTANLSMLSPSVSTLGGVGDKAEWGQIGGQTPEIVAHQGDITCVVLPPSDESVLTLPHQGSGPVYPISASDAQAYAEKMGTICNDVFAAAG